MTGFVTCGPNEALVISGCCYSKPFLMPGGRVFVWPWFQKIQKISLNTMTLTIESPKVYTLNGVQLSLTGISQVKVCGNNADKLLSACENFLGKTEAEMIKIVEETLEGHQREIMAKLPIEKIYSDRKEFSKQVYQVASSDLADMGLTVISYTVKDVYDDEGYLEALGLAQTAKVKMDAKKDEINELKIRKICEFDSNKDQYTFKYNNDIEIIKAQHEFNKKKTEYNIEVFREQANLDLVDQLQETVYKKDLIEESLNVQLEQENHLEKIISVEENLKKLELKCAIELLADKEKERIELMADAEKKKLECETEADVESIKLLGEAKAFELIEKNKVEFNLMNKRVEAYNQFSNAAKIDMLLQTLPLVAAEICDPVTMCNKITMISQGEGEIGLNKVTSEILDIITKMYSTLNNLSSSFNLQSNSNLISNVSTHSPTPSISTPPISSLSSTTYGERKLSAARTSYLNLKS